MFMTFPMVCFRAFLSNLRSSSNNNNYNNNSINKIYSAPYILRAHSRITYSTLKQNKLTSINNHKNIFEIKKSLKAFEMTQVSSMPSMNKVVHSIALEQYVQMNDPLLTLSEFSLFQVDFHPLPILFRAEVSFSSVN